jgi:PAS domain S-box-containing protein
MLRILHVDDSLADLELTKLSIIRLDNNLSLDWATSASEGLVKLLEAKYDCIISDFQMPVMDGLAFLRVIRDRGKDIPFIFVTGQGSEEVAAEAFRSGADDYFTKDIGVGHYRRLLNSIRRVVEARVHRSRQQMIEQALHESEEKYRNLVDLANDAIIIIQDGLVKFANPRLRALNGFDTTEIVGKPVEFLIYPDEIERVTRIYQRRISRKGAPRIYETALRHANGERVHVEFSSGRVVFQGKEAVLILIRDIRQRKRAEEALKESEKKFKDSFEYAAVGRFITAPDGRFVKVNRTLCRMLGYSKRELLSINSFDLIHPDHRGQARERIRDLWAKENRIYSPELLITHKKGHNVWVHLHGVVVRDNNGEPLYVLADVVDVSERKELEGVLSREKRILEMIFKNAPYAISIYDREGKFVRANRAYKKLFQSSPPEWYSLFKDKFLLEHGVGPDLVRLREGKCITTKGVWYNPHDTHPDLPDKPVYLRGSAFSIKDRSGEIEFYVLALGDFTELEELAEELAQTRSDVSRLEMTCSVFTEAVGDGITSGLKRLATQTSNLLRICSDKLEAGEMDSLLEISETTGDLVDRLKDIFNGSIFMQGSGSHLK